VIVDAHPQVEIRPERCWCSPKRPKAAGSFRATTGSGPKKFLEAILLELKRHGLLHSKKGKGGGYFLGRKPTEITVGQVIRVLDGPLALTPCVSQTAYRKCDECLDEKTCGVRLAMKEVRDATAEILDHTTLAGLNAQVARVGRRKK
jgi:Rrf2 family protein